MNLDFTGFVSVTFFKKNGDKTVPDAKKGTKKVTNTNYFCNFINMDVIILF